MDTEQELEYVKYFPRQWLNKWLAHLRGEGLRGSLSYLHKDCGLSARYTSVDPAPDPKKLDFEKFVRSLEGMCAYEDEEEFVKFGTERLREIYRFYQEHGKEFHQQFKRKK